MFFNVLIYVLSGVSLLSTLLNGLHLSLPTALSLFSSDTVVFLPHISLAIFPKSSFVPVPFTQPSIAVSPLFSVVDYTIPGLLSTPLYYSRDIKQDLCDGTAAAVMTTDLVVYAPSIGFDEYPLEHLVAFRDYSLKLWASMSGLLELLDDVSVPEHSLDLAVPVASTPEIISGPSYELAIRPSSELAVYEHRDYFVCVLSAPQVQSEFVDRSSSELAVYQSHDTFVCLASPNASRVLSNVSQTSRPSPVNERDVDYIRQQVPSLSALVVIGRAPTEMPTGNDAFIETILRNMSSVYRRLASIFYNLPWTRLDIPPPQEHWQVLIRYCVTRQYTIMKLRSRAPCLALGITRVEGETVDGQEPTPSESHESSAKAAKRKSQIRSHARRRFREAVRGGMAHTVTTGLVAKYTRLYEVAALPTQFVESIFPRSAAATDSRDTYQYQDN
ncbi:hypothetical protein GLOTRDRAFT_129192 [Gloeophyllum trabeum ATCC 11539]|uniref:Uncharacterized protein n=1 Tax=Gloeophyllum trabeum (strain ATCC 11539 / FP-39264 / Madison 617) TaxID=670483 RepID=S7RNE9_GLOTA|nr:uncharacterized protein GLOTRDRAFT_129192 [Gloeophyllum trabeum ATCC 11539]EPQ55985.1 hypothetical protein GLOTRDRAFT_129192 [Gloeophyllum trabeum ATCC 11539]